VAVGGGGTTPTSAVGYEMNWEVGGVADPPGMARIWPAIVAEGGSMSHAGGFRMAVGLCVRLQVFGTPKCVLQRCIAERNCFASCRKVVFWARPPFTIVGDALIVYSLCSEKSTFWT
jgi:hypothetical protein